MRIVIIHWCEYVGGARDDPPAGFPVRFVWLLMGLWWALLGVLVAAFCGQSSRFIYIDF
jgi:hypothetical protein